jgi:hypothetical protein
VLVVGGWWLGGKKEEQKVGKNMSKFLISATNRFLESANLFLVLLLFFPSPSTTNHSIMPFNGQRRFTR